MARNYAFCFLAFVLLLLLAEPCLGEIQSKRLTLVRPPTANWLNTGFEGSFMTFVLETEFSQSEGSAVQVILLVGLPFETTSYSAYLSLSTSVCTGASDMDENEDNYMAKMAPAENPRNKGEGLNYFWIWSEDLLFTGNRLIVLKIKAEPADSNPEGKLAGPIDIAFTSTSDDGYTIFAWNPQITFRYIAPSANSTVSISDKTTSGLADRIGESFVATVRFRNYEKAPRLAFILEGYEFNSDVFASFQIEMVSQATDKRLQISSTEFEVVEATSSIFSVRMVEDRKNFPSGIYEVALSMVIPMVPTDADLSILLMDKYGPNILEYGTKKKLFTSRSLSWSSNYPKMRISYGIKAEDNSSHRSMRLYTIYGTSIVYNHLAFFLKTIEGGIPEGEQSIDVTIGSLDSPAIPACGTIVHNLDSADDSGTTICACSSSKITVCGIDIEPGKEYSLAVKVGYTESKQIKHLGRIVLKVDGSAIVSGSPSMKYLMSTPVQNNPLLPPQKWSEHIVSAFGSNEVLSGKTITSQNVEDNFKIDENHNGLRQGDGLYFYFWSRLGPYEFFTKKEISSTVSSRKIFMEVITPKDIEADYENKSNSNSVVYIGMLGKLDSELALEDFYNEEEKSGWLYDAVERPLCDEDLDENLDDPDIWQVCVDWFCTEDKDGDGSYESPMPCRPIRACNSGTTTLWYPVVEDPFRQFESYYYKEYAQILSDDADYEYLRSDSDSNFSDSSDSPFSDDYSSFYSDYTTTEDGSSSDLFLNYLTARNIIFANLAYPEATAGHVDGETCRPIQWCDYTDKAPGEAIYPTKRKDDADCLRSDVPYCTRAEYSDNRIFNLLSDWSYWCIDVPPCDFDTDDDGMTDTRIDGAYCHPINPKHVRYCNLNSEPHYSHKYASFHKSDYDCVSIPLCNSIENSKKFDKRSTLTTLGDFGTNCLEVKYSERCNMWMLSDYYNWTYDSPIEVMQEFPGFTMKSSSDYDYSDYYYQTPWTEECVYVPFCNAAPESKRTTLWISRNNHVEGLFCTNGLPVCNMTPHRMMLNAPLFLKFYDDEDMAEYRGFSDMEFFIDYYSYRYDNPNYFCYMLDACDTFVTTHQKDYLRERADGKACYKEGFLNLNSYITGSQGEKSLPWFVDMTDYANKRCDSKRTLNIYTGFVSTMFETTVSGPYHCFPNAFCNAVDDDGNEIHRGLFGIETQCFPESVSHAFANAQNVEKLQKSWGITAPFTELVVEQTTHTIMDVNSDLWNVPCTIRTDKKTTLDANPYDTYCSSVDLTELCSRDLKKGTGFSSTSNEYDLFDAGFGPMEDTCIYNPNCYFNGWIQNSKYYMHAKGKGSSVLRPFESLMSYPFWWQYSRQKYKWTWPTEACQIEYVGENVDYVSPLTIHQQPAVTFRHRNMRFEE